MSAKTMFDKIWDAHVVRTEPDGTTLLYIDRHLVHEVTSPQAFEALKLAGRPVRRPGATLAVPDHNVPTTDRRLGIADALSAKQITTLEENCGAFGITLFGMNDVRFDALGVFPYSQEPDTPAGRMKDQIPSEIKEQRVETLMLTQQKVAFELADTRVGSRFDVLVDGIDEQGRVIARHVGQAPTVDSVTLIGNCNADSGQFVNVRCTDREGYDLVAVPTRVSLPVMGAKD